MAQQSQSKVSSSATPAAATKRSIMSSIVLHLLYPIVLLGLYHQVINRSPSSSPHEHQHLHLRVDPSAAAAYGIHDAAVDAVSDDYAAADNIPDNNQGRYLQKKTTRGRRKEAPWKNDPPPKYTSFQALGFGIFTGPALGATEKTLCDFSPGNCPDGVTILGDRRVCANCLDFTPECGCELTGDPENPIKCEQDRGTFDAVNYAPFCYIGIADELEDVKGRIEILRDAVEMAYEQADPSTNVLKIFNAPEFYFRGATGAYSFDSIVRREDDGDGFGAINEIGRELEAIVADVRFVDWLFVFGTVVAADTEYNGDDKKILYFNFAPVYKGYDPDTDNSIGKRFIAPKQFISHIDFLTARDDIFTVPGASGNEVYETDKWGDVKEFLKGENGYQFIENDWFEMNELLMSIEICLDHYKGAAKNSRNDLIANGGTIPAGGTGFKEVKFPRNRKAQVSLVTSAGMSIEERNIVLAEGASIFLQDGLNPFYLKTVATFIKDGVPPRPPVLNYRNPLTKFPVYDDATAREKLKSLYTLKTLENNEVLPAISVYAPLLIPNINSATPN